VIVVANALVNFVIVFGLFTIFLLITGNFPGLPYVAVIPVLVLLVLFAIGLGITGCSMYSSVTSVSFSISP
jgi:lipopolysaccharide transport system permease protein